MLVSYAQRMDFPVLRDPQYVLCHEAFGNRLKSYIFIGIAGPNVIETSVARTDLNNSLKLKPFNLSSPPLSTYNQQLWLTCVVELDQHDVSLTKNVTMTVKVLGVVKDGSTPYVNNQVHNRTRLLSCAQKCSEIIVAHLGYLNYTQYNIFVSFEDLNKLTYTIQNITFTWKTYNPTFSQVEIWFRFVFVVLTFMVTCLFAHSLRKFSMRDWGIEQKWMSILLPLLLLYNDPFFPLSFLGERKCLTFYLPKFFIVGLLWLASVTLGIWQTVNEVHDPTYQYRVDTGNFQGMKIFFLVVATTYILYLLFLIVRACSELRNMPYVESQLKDNPAFSMLNDSDDDVIYGSDYEEMPLQNGQAIRAKYKEESDKRIMFHQLPELLTLTISNINMDCSKFKTYLRHVTDCRSIATNCTFYGLGGGTNSANVRTSQWAQGDNLSWQLNGTNIARAPMPGPAMRTRLLEQDKPDTPDQPLSLLRYCVTHPVTSRLFNCVTAQ
ncbi:hypothetical protein IHE44_0009333 [Lamprotornis superbus]|uniref:Uncharacterized protein n=1 Tax=Lamprotornis superbus TaxID=245042 RepID=A0A835U250_9PASS|nr:hypothetical protein IHE44_0009333 [Lamprotornis superbus]